MRVLYHKQPIQTRVHRQTTRHVIPGGTRGRESGEIGSDLYLFEDGTTYQFEDGTDREWEHDTAIRPPDDYLFEDGTNYEFEDGLVREWEYFA